MRYLLDSNICIHFFRNKFEIKSKLQEAGLYNCAISEITLAEIVYGAEKSDFPEHNHHLISEFVKELVVLPRSDAIYIYGKEKARLRKSGNLVGDFDILIGCTAITYNLILVSENVKDLSTLSGLQLENWVKRIN